VKKRTWRLRALPGDVSGVVSAASSYKAAAAALGVDKSTVFRWVKAGQVPAPGGKHHVTVPPVPEGWASAIRGAYDLDATETELVRMAETALALAGDLSLKPTDRLAAMARFQRLVVQLDLEVPDGEVEKATNPRAWPRRVR
jgi:hypothetical protein